MQFNSGRNQKQGHLELVFRLGMFLPMMTSDFPSAGFFLAKSRPFWMDYKVTVRPFLVASSFSIYFLWFSFNLDLVFASMEVSQGKTKKPLNSMPLKNRVMSEMVNGLASRTP